MISDLARTRSTERRRRVRPVALDEERPLSLAPESPQQVMALQRSAGNRAVATALALQRQFDPLGFGEEPYDTPSLMDDRAGNEPPRADAVLPGKLRTLLEDKKGNKAGRAATLVSGYDIVDRNAVMADADLMKLAKDKMPAQGYISFLTALQMIAPGTTPSGVPHTSATKADELIRAKLGDYVKKAVKAGKKVEGSVAVVKGDDWTLAYEAEFGKGDADEPNVNAFVDKKDRIIIHAERGNPGTTIHEGVHKYAPNNVLDTWGFEFNEGVTEYFTRQITDAMDPPVARTNYQSNFDVMKKLVGVVTEEKLAKAYFEGALSDLKSTWRGAGKTNKQWNDLVKAVKQKKWTDAEALL